VFVLLVEDDPLIQLALAVSLDHAGYRTETAMTVDHALDRIARANGELRLLITDIRARGSDGKTGWDVAQYARQVMPDLPIIYISDDHTFRRHAHGARRSIVTKLFRVSEVLDRLEKRISPFDTVSEVKIEDVKADGCE
jgi:DNA-binding response OmpR family regulator